jgi:Zn finger protein HypA/HybF involved in hydrogenase expression
MEAEEEDLEEIEEGEEEISEDREKGKQSYLDEDMFNNGEEEIEKEDSGENDADTEVVYRMIKCPHCDGPVPVTTKKRPVVVICPSCGSKGRLVR